ncbi:MAG: hypothetical protein CL693_01730 [Cellvibrionaceae bacterium]|nr:hypothetical protein [Cellvibrionaceae bacterium]|tara:strand:+ start:24557 stop:25729 length:1173 start_codon:yes stop_codon:yes gene_type:complete
MKKKKTPTRLPKIILVGGGHAHALFLLYWSKLSEKPAAVTLISLSDYAPYSGMLPGLVAGHFGHDETHIDLRELCRHAGATFIQGRADAVDPSRQQVMMSNDTSLNYDILSINAGAGPNLATTGADNLTIPVKPISDFYQVWMELLSQIQTPKQFNAPLSIAVVGGGASGVELIQAMHHRLQREAASGASYNLSLVQRGRGQPENYPKGLQQKFATRLARQGIAVHEKFSVNRVEKNTESSLLHASDGRKLAANYIIWCTQAIGAPWLKRTQLPLDGDGFIEIEDTLQAVGHPLIFACGDCASMVNHKIPKAGVYAVRQAETLTHNILALLNKESLRVFKPQRSYLSIVTGGDQWALAARGGLSLPICSPRLVWQWKRHIDKRFMAQFQF